MSFLKGFVKVAYTKPELKEMIKEHKHLLGVFSRNNRKQELREASKQTKELKGYIRSYLK